MLGLLSEWTAWDPASTLCMLKSCFPCQSTNGSKSQCRRGLEPGRTQYEISDMEPCGPENHPFYAFIFSPSWCQETAKLINRNEMWSIYSTGDQDSQGSFTQRRLEAQTETYGYRTGPDKPSHRLSLFSLSGLPGSPPRTPRLPPSKLSRPLPHLFTTSHNWWPSFLAVTVSKLSLIIKMHTQISTNVNSRESP